MARWCRYGPKNGALEPEEHISTDFIRRCCDNQAKQELTTTPELESHRYPLNKKLTSNINPEAQSSQADPIRFNAYEGNERYLRLHSLTQDDTNLGLSKEIAHH